LVFQQAACMPGHKEATEKPQRLYPCAGTEVRIFAPSVFCPLVI
jgi:hypothetical protein